jgi:hypothetical protein
MKPADMETLLMPQSRARLSLGRQLLLYLDPFALFKDASQGPKRARELALAYNRAMRWVLVTYLRRWVLIAAALFLCISPAEALAAQTSAVIVPAAFAVGCCIAVAICTLTAAVYLLLGSSES